ncbi:histidinol-phosphate transaminase [Candidatus Enterococcus willemsii]|uniref:Histidinol-phosphate aminotransferase n=1 Tax=Candidatus Enterococcus willemsii TaxID=1857215 RepID=A0ABQ6Z1Y3_9ENTE|nr:histidinol-phosphate transaminase [Enterococcus sp. CU12B]KAF1305550.1 histidinol-phosphate transaminase [Enterococcus sp. CU12B]
MRFLDQQFKHLVPYVPGEQNATEKIIKLNTNENPYDPPQAVIEAAKDAAQTLSRYSDPTCKEVIVPLAKHLKVAPENIFLGNGSDEILSFLFQGFMEKGVQFPDITYGFYRVYSDLFHLTATEIPLRDDLSIELADYQGTETVVIANPNAPTGIALHPEVIGAFASQHPERLIIVDEAYSDFSDVSMVPYLSKHPNVLVVGTFSKSRHLAGGRLGYAVGASEIINDLNTLKFSHNPYSVNAMTLACGAASLASQDYVDESTQKIIDTRTWTIQALRELAFDVTDSQGNFVFAQHATIAGEKLFLALKEKHILVRWFNQPRIANYLRISIGTQSEMEQLIQVLKEEVQP